MAHKAVQIFNSVVNYLLLVVILLLLSFAAYALWDTDQLYAAAHESNYTVYKPTPGNEAKTFAELQDINPEVFAWLSIYGTHIDYPVVQSVSNMKYVNTNAEGNYSLTGAIFLDAENRADFSDFNSILYGHHMEKEAMFGEIGHFSQREFFDTHRYGNLYYSGRDHGIEFFAFLHEDAYNGKVFWPAVSEDGRQDYLDNLLMTAILTRDIGASCDDHIVLLTTCSPSTTNGRDVLVGRITDEVFADPFPATDARQGGSLMNVDHLSNVLGKIPLWAWLLLVIIVLPVLLLLLLLLIRRRRDEQQEVIRQVLLVDRAQLKGQKEPYAKAQLIKQEEANKQDQQDKQGKQEQQDKQDQQDKQAPTLGGKQ